MKPVFFESPQSFRAWLEKHHDTQKELWVGLHKKSSGRPSITWPEAVDAALCFGWIDGVRKSLGPHSYAIRFSPRKLRSVWSTVNIRRVAALEAAGLMQPAGRKTFEACSEARSAIYSYERKKAAKLPAAFEKQFRARRRAWTFFREQPASYRRTCVHWVISAKKKETRGRRLSMLIEDSAHGQRTALLRRPAK
ncbi:MAG TPA: YdeI/OmpD-associated family protein [Candidatus Acidoferrales bacterium]|nr:YdeI/OmpD-associated family protein [Candidatus Acidoferrales bacterium]